MLTLPRTDGWTHEFAIVNYHQSDRCLHKSSRQHRYTFSWSRFQTADAKVLFDVVCGHVLEHFKPKNPKYLQRKVLAKRSWQMGGTLLKTGLLSSLQQWLLTADVKEMTVNSIGNARSI